jgi:hypothetical protein
MANRLQQLEAETDTPMFERMPRFGSGKENNQIINFSGSGRRGSLGLPTRPQQNKELRRQFSHETLPSLTQNSIWEERQISSISSVHHILPFTPQSKVLLPNQQQTTTQRIMPQIPIRRLEKSESLTRSDAMFRSNSQVEPFVNNSGRKLPQRQKSNELWEMTDTTGLSNVSYGNLNESSLPQPQTQFNKQLPRITPQQQAMLRERTIGLLNTSVTTVPSELVDMSSSHSFVKKQLFSSNGFPKKSHLDPSSAALHVFSDKNRIHSGNRRRSTAESVIRNDSLSSDQSECVRPPPPKPHKNRNKLGKKLRPYSSLSSSDEEVRSTPECSTEEDQDIESESISEKGEHIDKNLKCQKIMKPEEILDAKIKKFLAVSIKINFLVCHSLENLITYSIDLFDKL